MFQPIEPYSIASMETNMISGWELTCWRNFLGVEGNFPRRHETFLSPASRTRGERKVSCKPSPNHWLIEEKSGAPACYVHTHRSTVVILGKTPHLS